MFSKQALPNVSSAPTLETDRLRLRAHRVEDFAQYRIIWAEETVTRFIGGIPLTEDEAWLRLLRHGGHWPLMGFGFWIVEERLTGKVLGEAGMAEWHRDIDPSILGTPEAGWVFASAAHGKGYAAEAMRGVLKWAAIQLAESQRTVCLIDPRNTPSLRLAERLGYAEYSRPTFRGEPTILLERDQP